MCIFSQVKEYVKFSSIHLSYSIISAFWVKDKASFLLEMNIFSAS